MKVLVTGASGYIGGSVATALLAAGHRVVGLVRSGERAAEVRARGIAELERRETKRTRVHPLPGRAARSVNHTVRRANRANPGAVRTSEHTRARLCTKRPRRDSAVFNVLSVP